VVGYSLFDDRDAPVTGMPMHEYDKSSKWLIQHHGDSILRMAGVTDIDSWQPLQAELIQPRRLPDGLIEVQRAGAPDVDLYVLEIATYPEARIVEQAVRAAALVYLDRKVVPDVLVLVLHPRGNASLAEATTLRSRRGWSTWQLSWRTVRLWTVPAETLFSAGDVGLIPWVPLTHFEEQPEIVLRKCRERIDHDARPNEHENLLAVTQFLAQLRYNDPRLLELLGGRKAMIESPLIQEFITEARREDLVTFLTSRFGAQAEELESDLKSIEDANRLTELIKGAGSCRSLRAFRKLLKD
jgi:hypothetical protein